MSVQMMKFKVESANWSMYMEVDTNIFDDPYIEACTRCIEEKLKHSLSDPSSEFLLNSFMTIHKVTKNGQLRQSKTINSYKILLNAGLPSRAKLLRKVIYTDHKVDLAHEPISSSKA